MTINNERDKYVLIPKDTMTYAKYLSYKTGLFHDNSNRNNLEEDEEQTTTTIVKPLINSHILYASVGGGANRKSISHQGNEIHYSNLFKEEKLDIVEDFTFENLKQLFEDNTKIVVVIPGIKMVEKVNNKTQYKIFEHNNKEIVIQKGAYTEFIKYIRKMPGTFPQIVNYIESFDYSADENSPKNRIQYIKNIYKNDISIDYEPTSIGDFFDKLDSTFYKTFNIDLFVSHQSKDKEPYINDYINKYRRLNPQKLVWYDKDFFQKNVASDSNYARNTIAHGLMNAKKIEIVMSNNYFDKLLKNISEDADYFGINYELALIANIKSLPNRKIEKGKIHLYEFKFKGLNLKDKIFDFTKYPEINCNLKLEDIDKRKIKTSIMGSLDYKDIELRELKYLHKDLS